MNGIHSKNKMDKKVLVIQARMGSKRFPGKMMASFAGLTIIDWVLGRAKRAKKVDEFVLAIPESTENNVLAEKGQHYGYTIIRGAEEDVLSRFAKAALLTNADIIIRVCADNPFICPNEIDRLIKFFLKKRPDYSFNHINMMNNNYPDGLGAEIFTRLVLEDLNVSCSNNYHREHVTSYIWDNLYKYIVLTFNAPKNIAFPNIKLDIDFEEDLSYLEQVISKVLKNNSEYENTLFDLSPELFLGVINNG